MFDPCYIFLLLDVYTLNLYFLHPPKVIEVEQNFKMQKK